MKKTMNILALLLTVCMVFLLTACNKKQITAEKFVSVLEDNGLYGSIVSEVSEEYKTAGVVEGAYGTEPVENSLYEAYYYRYASEEAATAKYKSVLEEYNNIVDNEVVTGTVDESGKGSMKRAQISANSAQEVGELGLYSVTVQVDEVVVILFAFDNTQEQIEKIDSILKDCGYDYQ